MAKDSSSEHRVEDASTTDGLPVAVSMGEALEAAHVPRRAALVDGRTVVICGLAVVLAIIAGVVAQVLQRLIFLVTNISFHGAWSMAPAEPGNHLGFVTVAIPAVGGIVVGLMARYGSRAIRGHGIPEAMEQVLLNESRIPARLTFLKPLSAAVAIGTGGPFGAEGPIIATGGALGSLIGQVLRTTAVERKTLLAAGAAAGMAATFGSPVSAVLLAVELLLFEFRARSIIPVALASAVAAGMRLFLMKLISGELPGPVFHMPEIGAVGGAALAIYIGIGALMGLAAVGVTRLVYWIEDLFEKLPIHWMWWPAIGGVVVGVVGLFAPRTMGVGYANISDIISARFAWQALAVLAALKLLSWSIALGSGTSGGTLAPLFTIGGGMGALLGMAAAHAFPGAGVRVEIAGLVGMAAIFAGASRALLASAVFAFEATLQPLGLLPLLGGCTASYLISCLLMRNTIMTEKIARRGVQVPAEYEADFLDRVLVRDVATANPVTLKSEDTLKFVRAWVASGVAGTSHQGFAVMEGGHVSGVVTRRDLLNPANDDARTVASLLNRPPVVVYADCTLREAADHMVNHDVGRLPVMDRREPGRMVGFITRSDVLRAHRRRLDETQTQRRHLRLKVPSWRKQPPKPAAPVG